jgi:predicted MFS family arabinose efflux permease
MASTRSEDAPAHGSVRRGLRAIIAANAVSTLGDGAFIAAAPLAAAALTRDPAAVALVSAAETLPWVIVAPFAGVFVDRWPRRSTMIGADTTRAVAVGILALMTVAELVSVPAIALCAFVIMAGTVFHSAAAEAVVADLAGREPDRLNRVNGALQTTTTSGRQMLGPPAGSWSWSIAGWLPFAFDAVSFALSAVTLLFVPRQDKTATQRNRIWHSMKEGASFLLHHSQIRLLAILTGVANLSVNAGLAILVLYATDANGLSISVAGYGLLLTLMAVGGLAGGVAVPRVLRLVDDRVAFAAGMLAEAIAWVTILLTRSPVVAGGALAVIGFTVAIKSVIIMGTRQRLVPSDLLGRVISAYRVIGNGMAPIGAVVGGLIAHQWGLRAGLAFAALVLPFGAIAALRALRHPNS